MKYFIASYPNIFGQCCLVGHPFAICCNKLGILNHLKTMVTLHIPTFSSPEAAILLATTKNLRADQKDRSLWGRQWHPTVWPEPPARTRTTYYPWSQSQSQQSPAQSQQSRNMIQHCWFPAIVLPGPYTAMSTKVYSTRLERKCSTAEFDNRVVPKLALNVISKVLDSSWTAWSLREA